MNWSVRPRMQKVRSKAPSSSSNRLRLSIYLVAGGLLFGVARGKTQPFLDHVKRAPLHFGVNPAEILTENAKRHELHAAHKKHRDKQRGPTSREVLIHQAIDNRHDDARYGYPDREKAGPDRQLQRHE